jgi:inner membrane protein
MPYWPASRSRVASPVGHFLAGAVVALAADQRGTLAARAPSALLVCGLLAAAPDLDLLVPGAHRTATHSFTAAGFVFLAGLLLARRWTELQWRLPVVWALAYATHVVVDYLSTDLGTPAGLQALWPWSHQWFISSWHLFRGTERVDPLSSYAITMNSLALAQELLLMGPMLFLAWRRRRRLTTSVVPLASSGPSRRVSDRLTQAPDGQ